MMTIEKRMAEHDLVGEDIKLLIREHHQDLEEIQLDCPHEKREVRDAGWAGRSYYVFCCLCRKELGRPETPEELAQQKVLEDEHARAFQVREWSLRYPPFEEK